MSVALLRLASESFQMVVAHMKLVTKLSLQVTVVFSFLWLKRWGQLNSMATILRTATVKSVAQMQALEGEGKAFVGVGERWDFP